MVLFVPVYTNPYGVRSQSAKSSNRSRFNVAIEFFPKRGRQ